MADLLFSVEAVLSSEGKIFVWIGLFVHQYTGNEFKKKLHLQEELFRKYLVETALTFGIQGQDIP